ncbi:hypothetical protein Tco_0413913 [Tanacetum coccineum]
MFNSTLRNPITHPHCEALKTVPEAGQSSMSRDGSVFVYNPDVVREQFAGVELLIESISIDLKCFNDGFATKAKDLFNGYFQGLYNTYYLKYGDPTTQSTSAASSSTSHSEEILEEEVLEHEAIALSDEEIALDKADSEASPTDPKEKMLI